MNYLERSEAHLRHLDERAKRTLWVIILCVVVMVIYAAWKREALTSSTRIYLTTDTSDALAKGDVAKISGFKVGMISNLELQPDRTVKVELKIFDDYLSFIRKDSIALLRSEGLIGGSYIEILPGSPNERFVRGGDNLVFQREESIADISKAVRDQLTPINQEILTLLSSFNNPDGEFRKLMGNLENSTRSLDELLPQLLNRVDQTLANVEVITGGLKTSLDQYAASIQGLLDYINSPDGDLKKIMTNVEGATQTLPEAVQNLNQSLESAEKLTADLSSAMEKAAPEIPVLISEGVQLAKDADDVLRALKSMWPLKNTTPLQPAEALDFPSP